MHLAGLDLSGASFAQTYLSHSDFRGADLRDVDFSHAFLANVNFGPGAGGTPTDLRNAKLTSANLAYADLHMADLTGADLTRAQLYEADLRGADLREAHLGDAKLEGAIYDEKTTFPSGFDPDKAGLRRAN